MAIPILILSFCVALSVGASDEKLEEAYSYVYNMHQHWYAQAVDGLLTSMQKKTLQKLPALYRKSLRDCFSKAPDILEKAKCLNDAFDYRRGENAEKIDWIGSFGVLAVEKESVQNVTKSEEESWVKLDSIQRTTTTTRKPRRRNRTRTGRRRNRQRTNRRRIKQRIRDRINQRRRNKNRQSAERNRKTTESAQNKTEPILVIEQKPTSVQAKPDQKVTTQKIPTTTAQSTTKKVAQNKTHTTLAQTKVTTNKVRSTTAQIKVTTEKAAQRETEIAENAKKMNDSTEIAQEGFAQTNDSTNAQKMDSSTEEISESENKTEKSRKTTTKAPQMSSKPPKTDNSASKVSENENKARRRNKTRKNNPKPSRRRGRKRKRKRLRGRARLAYLNRLAGRKRTNVIDFRRRRLRARVKRAPLRLSRMPELKIQHQPNLFTDFLNLLTGKRQNNGRKSTISKIGRLRKYVRLQRLAAKRRNRLHPEDPNPITQLLSLLFEPGNAANKTSGRLKFLSPKLFSIVPDNSNSTVLSPDILPLYKSAGAILSLPSLFDGMQNDEHERWLEMIMQLSGADKSVDKVLQYFEDPTPKSEQQKIVQANLRIMDYWDRVIRMFSSKQKLDMKNDGYSFLTSNQLDLLYGQEGLYNMSISDHNLDLELLAKMNEDEKEEALEKMVRRMATGKQDPALRGWNRRLKQSVLEPAAFAPGILAPGVLGAAVLSPNVFSPAILSPSALAPPILSPSVGSPAILSPFVLGPAILSPVALAPLILTPYALSPTVLSPIALSPLVLSPYVLSPDILGPAVLSGNILSPYSLSPAILNPGILNADVLSPGDVLSPSILS